MEVPDVRCVRRCTDHGCYWACLTRRHQSPAQAARRGAPRDPPRRYRLARAARHVPGTFGPVAPPGTSTVAAVPAPAASPVIGRLVALLRRVLPGVESADRAHEFREFLKRSLEE